MQHSTISRTYGRRFWWYGKFRVNNSKKRARQNKQQSIKLFPFKSSNTFQAIANEEESNDDSQKNDVSKVVPKKIMMVKGIR